MKALTMRLLSQPLNQIKQLAHTDGILEIVRQLLVPEKAEATEDGGALNEKGQ
jgi:hypothetical protein